MAGGEPGSADPGGAPILVRGATLPRNATATPIRRRLHPRAPRPQRLRDPRRRRSGLRAAARAARRVRALERPDPAGAPGGGPRRQVGRAPLGLQRRHRRRRRRRPLQGLALVAARRPADARRSRGPARGPAPRLQRRPLGLGDRQRPQPADRDAAAARAASPSPACSTSRSCSPRPTTTSAGRASRRSAIPSAGARRCWRTERWRSGRAAPAARSASASTTSASTRTRARAQALPGLLKRLGEHDLDGDLLRRGRQRGARPRGAAGDRRGRPRGRLPRLAPRDVGRADGRRSRPRTCARGIDAFDGLGLDDRRPAPARRPARPRRHRGAARGRPALLLARRRGQRASRTVSPCSPSSGDTSTPACMLPPLGPVREQMTGSPGPARARCLPRLPRKRRSSASQREGGFLTIVLHLPLLDWLGEDSLAIAPRRATRSERRAGSPAAARSPTHVLAHPEAFVGRATLDPTSWALGAPVSAAGGTRNCRVAGVLSRLPAASIARTSKTCLPGFRRLYFFGERQGLNGFLSSLHWKVEPASLETNLNVAVRPLTFFLTIVVSGRGLVLAPLPFSFPLGVSFSFFSPPPLPPDAHRRCSDRRSSSRFSAPRWRLRRWSGSRRRSSRSGPAGR